MTESYKPTVFQGKNSIDYFMTKMSQEEFDEIRYKRPIENYEFNKIKRINGIDRKGDESDSNRNLIDEGK